MSIWDFSHDLSYLATGGMNYFFDPGYDLLGGKSPAAPPPYKKKAAYTAAPADPYASGALKSAPYLTPPAGAVGSPVPNRTYTPNYFEAGGAVPGVATDTDPQHQARIKDMLMPRPGLQQSPTPQGGTGYAPPLSTVTGGPPGMSSGNQGMPPGGPSMQGGMNPFGAMRPQQQMSAPPPGGMPPPPPGGMQGAPQMGANSNPQLMKQMMMAQMLRGQRPM